MVVNHVSLLHVLYNLLYWRKGVSAQVASSEINEENKNGSLDSQRDTFFVACP